MDSPGTTKGAPQAPQQSVIPAISLPKGGGAIRGIGEKFAANPVNGSGSMSVPIVTSPGRSGFSPQLSLSYDSGAGNGPFGFGWGLSLPVIARKTDKGLPRYLDAIDSDVFILSGSEDLVPAYRQDVDGTWIAANPGFQRDADGHWVRDASGLLVVQEDDVDGFRVRRYRPRIEGIFARIERWSRPGMPGDVHWRSISKDNILTLYGCDAHSRIADPLDPTRIFSWLICESRDDKGNGIRFLYKDEDGAWQPRAGQADPFRQPHQCNRGGPSDPRRTAQRYLHRVMYGNAKPLLDAQGKRPRNLGDLPQPPDTSGDWSFELRFDYGELDENDPLGKPEMAWLYRPDAFSSYRAGFEVRTCRRCERVLMLHHIPDQPAGGPRGYQGVVRSVDLAYDDEIDPGIASKPIYSFLKQFVLAGWKQDGGATTRRSLPPTEFEYTQPIVQDTVKEVDAESLENLPIGLDGSAYRWIDLHGEGIPGILTEHSGAWFYKRNWSPIPVTLADGSETVKARFAPLERVALKPNVALAAGIEIMDLAGDGQPDLVVMSGPIHGLYEHDDDEGWEPLRPFMSRVHRDLRDANVKFVDLDGDGRPDVLIGEDEAFVWHASLAEDGFAPARRVAKLLDEEKGPRVVFADGTQSIYLADMSGDGLTDIVRIRNGEVCYWPNLGYCRFGAKVTMDGAPWFDNPDQFEQHRVRVADIDGSGTADIIYLHRDGIRLYFNQSGNGWSAARVLGAYPRADDLASVVPIDLLGNGTVCLVWSSSLPADARRPMRYVSLMGASKPHLLVATVSNLGTETRVAYAASTKFYLQDRRDGKPWITRLPFPVHVVERVQTYDAVSRNLFVTRYAYHHGYFDGEEREFRGFGMVEQWDTEQLAALAGGKLPADNLDAASHVPPVHKKTWFHTGVYTGRSRVSRHFEDEYFRDPSQSVDAAHAALLEDTVLPPKLTLEEEREACRALKGSVLREEVYADDANGPDATEAQIERARTPYTATVQNFKIVRAQARGANRHTVFVTHASEALSYHCERNAADPRTQHTLTLEVDAFGNALKLVSIAYGRRVSPLTTPWDIDRQATPLVTYTENRVTNAIDADGDHRNPQSCESVSFELTGYVATGAAGRFQKADFVEEDPGAPGGLRHKFSAPEVEYEASPAGGARRRRVEWIRTLYRRDDLTALLPLGEQHLLGLTGESYKLAFTRGLLDQVFQRPRQGQAAEALLPNPALLLQGQGADQGGYLQSQTLKADGRFPVTDADDRWWIASGLSFYSADPADSAAAELARARQHFFAVRRYRNAFGHDSWVDFDSHDLLIAQTRDALGNCTTVDISDYRVLQPAVVRDANRNQTAIAFDALGMVCGTAVMGKPLPASAEGDSLAGFVADLSDADIRSFFDAPIADAQSLLQGATTRIVYDLDRFRLSRRANPNDRSKWEPVRTAILGRETHASSPLPPQGLRIQVSITHCDGFGREIQKKVRCEAGPLDVNDAQSPVVNPRWVASGWTIFNNKGKPVRQYEPFFSATHGYEFGVTVGVSPVLFYDPLQRVVATLHPNHTYEKVRFDAWQQTTYDVNDTCAQRNNETGDPRTDPDIAGYVAGYFGALPAAQAQSWKTWHAQRAGGALGPDERNAVLRAEAHADTPVTAHFDTLGRTFLSVVRNRVECLGHPLHGSEQSHASRTELDLEGKQLSVRDTVVQGGDPLGRVVARHAYDMLGNCIHHLSMEAGARWMLNDASAKPIRCWDSRGHNFITAYDGLRRPVQQVVRGTSAQSDPRTLNVDIAYDRLEYGEPPINATAEQESEAQRLNLRTRVLRHSDSAGVVVNARLDAAGRPVEAFDFKGNLLHNTRRLVSDYKSLPNWLIDTPLDAESFESSTRHDALNRPTQSIAPHGSGGNGKLKVVQPVFNEANLLERVDVWLERAAEPAGLIDPAAEAPSPVGVADIDYDAKGQRVLIDLRSNDATVVRTTYAYDRETFRLEHQYTRRGVDPATAQGVGFSQDCDNPAPPPPLISAPATPPAGMACGLQNLRYTYDAAGNVTHIQDDAQQRVFFSNQRIDPASDYTYDALYRVLQATGREHLGPGGTQLPHSHNDALRVRMPHPNSGDLMARYCEKYVYDAAGNFVSMSHHRSCADNPGWTRAYEYLEASLIEGGGAQPKTSNRLTRTTLNSAGNAAQPENYLHDPHGNMVRLPHLGGGGPGANVAWDHKDRLLRADLGGGGNVFYGYDASGERVRKVWEKAPGLIEERIYLGGVEIFRSHGGAIGAGTATRERETLHVMDDKKRIALVETRTLDAADNDPAPRQLIRYQLGNRIGSSCLELDQGAQIVSYEEYAPFGSSTYQAVRSQTETAKRYRHTGKERDEESGLYYHGARYAVPWLGRWSSADPSGTVDGLNLYWYCRNNPVALSDPTGRYAGEENLDPETLRLIATALATAVARGAPAAAALAGTGTVAGGTATGGAGLLGAGGALVAAQALAAVAEGLAVEHYMRRSANIVMHGNPWAIHRDDLFPTLRELRKIRSEPFPDPGPEPKPKLKPDPEKDKDRKPRLGRIYVTYTKYNTITKLTYSGRTSAVIDLDLPWAPQADAAVAARDANHHKDESVEPNGSGFLQAQRDKYAAGYAVNYEERYRDLGYIAVRGREQQLIDHYGKLKADELGLKDFKGGAQSDTRPGAALTENSVRGVAKDNMAGEIFHYASDFSFGNLAPYTGDKLVAPSRR